MAKCTLCGEEILPETADRTGGRCMPCSRRRCVRLKDHQELEYLRISELLVSAGWRGDAPHMRVWLDMENELRRAIQRGSKQLHAALAIDNLTVRDCASAEEAALTIGRFRRKTFGRFAANDVREVCTEQGDAVQFVIGDRKFDVKFCDKARDRRNGFLATMNQALETAHVAQRFILLPSESSVWPVAFVTQVSYNQAIDVGVIPDHS